MECYLAIKINEALTPTTAWVNSGNIVLGERTRHKAT